MTKTVLFLCPDADGHVNALLGIADRLKDCYGYRTAFMVFGPKELDRIKKHGHELVPVKLPGLEHNGTGNGGNLASAVEGLRNEFMNKDKTESLIRVLNGMFKSNMSNLMKNHMIYTETIESVQADLIVSDAAIVLPCFINRRIQVPWIRVYSANPLFFTRATRPDGFRPPIMVGTSFLGDKEARKKLCQEEPERWQAILDEWKRQDDRFRAAKIGGQEMSQWFIDQGCGPVDLDSSNFDSPYMNVYLYPKEIDYDQDDDVIAYRPRMFRCDHMIRREPANTELWDKKIDEAMVGKSALIYFSLGTLASGDVKLVQQYVDIFKDDSSRLYVISKGSNGDQIKLDGSNLIGENYVPQTVILRRANTAIIHGGNNSLTECLYYGVPMVVLPVFADQLDNAQRVEDLGIGKRLDIYESSKEEVMQAVEDISNNVSMREKVQYISRQMQARDDLGKLVLMLNKLMHDGKIDEQFLVESKDKSLAELQVVAA